MSELADLHHESSTDANWRMDCPKSILVQATKSARNSISSSRLLLPASENSSDAKDNGCDINGNYTNEELAKPTAEERVKLSSTSSDSVCKEGTVMEDGTTAGSQKDCRGCMNCHCRCSTAVQRKTSTDLTFKACDIFANPNTMPLKRNVLGSTGGGGGGVGVAKSTEKMDKINLANLVFNPNFKNSAGCVNLPVIRAGQNLAQKNAQRSALSMAKDVIKDVTNNNISSSDLNGLTQQAAIDLLTQQLQQPQSLDKLSAKLQQLSQQRGLRGSNPELYIQSEDATTDLLQSLTGKQQQQQQQPPTQSNALRYKTELCRSYEEGGECRFGTACTFAHGPEELRPVPRHPLYKTEFCRTYHQHGYCQYGTRCHFIHDADEADKNAPLKGCKSWGRHDQLSGALLSLASSTGLLESDQQSHATTPAAAADNDVLLANLRRLYALRMMNGQERGEQPSTNNQFSMSQPMAHQLSMAHQQLSGSHGHGHLPLSMTQPLPMEALQLGLQRAGQMPHMNQRAPHHQMGQVSHGRVDSLANDYGGWGVNPQSPTYSGLSPFGNYQQFSPLPHHTGQQHQAAYPHYPFSATAPDLSAALSVSPYGVSPQGFSNTVNVGHLLPDQNGNYQAVPAPAAAVSNANMQQKTSVPVNAQTISSSQAHAVMPNAVWPPTSAEVSSVIDKELFGFGLDSQQAQNPNAYQQYQHPFFQSLNHQQQQQQQQQAQQQHHQQQVAAQDHSAKTYTSGSNQKSRQNEVDLLSLINSDKYATSKDSRGNMRTIAESDERDSQQQSVRPKVLKRSHMES